ncbi:zinc dependent phospholipase C family protein [Thermodesulfovibrio yellowstonii]|uniref:zinc dependent phospholipase C family protein n=1 Tax=Thermodesulfovibrio yellowstonii TaxID=28262 RepID=UPI0024B3654B|nr:zinc dependent phospholipase C family protein [Thermodesulfovibrio yellowstonii]MDI6865898.1 zinc dependent phospholipase C family protein [Thermodesulfovibrio yellowstonii]
MVWFLLFFIIFIFPENSYAWGPLTHAYLSGQIFSFSGLVPAGVLTIIKLYKEYFMYGNIIPDTVFGKKYLPEDKNPHSWKTGLCLLNEAKIPEEKSFAYGYLTHLAADAVLHNDIKNLTTLQHALFELKADRVIDRYYWIQIMSINKKVKKISEKFFEQTVAQSFLSLKTSTKIYKSLIFLSAFNTGELKNVELFESLHFKSLSAMIELLNNTEHSKIINLPPNN